MSPLGSNTRIHRGRIKAEAIAPQSEATPGGTNPAAQHINEVKACVGDDVQASDRLISMMRPNETAEGQENVCLLSLHRKSWLTIGMLLDE